MIIDKHNAKYLSSLGHDVSVMKIVEDSTAMPTTNDDVSGISNQISLVDNSLVKGIISRLLPKRK